MKSMHQLRLLSLLLTAALSVPVHADDASDMNGQQANINTSNLATYLINLGAYLGYDLTQQPQTPSSPLLRSTAAQLLSSSTSGQLPLFTLAFDALLGATPVNSLFSQFVPSTNTTYAPVNALANATFPSYNNVSSSQQTNTLTANSAIDQQTYQQDPVSQAVLNILGTPNYTYCMSYDGSTWTGGDTSPTGGTPFPKCTLLYQNQVMGNAIGNLPSTYQFYTYAYNQQFLSQLNGNTLISPLLYSTTSGSSSTSSSPQTSPEGGGLPAQTQIQQAANFIHYAAGDVSPISLPQLKDYDTLYTQAMNADKSVAAAVQMQAQATLTTYFAKLRSYAALTSVGYSNLYYILSKRMPQNMGGGGSSTTSEALNEFTMASWRLYTPGGSTNTNWLNQINQAPSATVQKEMATLLAEINYQLYLTRQQQERLLLTNTMLLLLSARTSPPTPPALGSTTSPQ